MKPSPPFPFPTLFLPPTLRYHFTPRITPPSGATHHITHKNPPKNLWFFFYPTKEQTTDHIMAVAAAGSGPVFTPSADTPRGKKRIFRLQIVDVHVGSGASALNSLFYRGWDKDVPSGGADYGSYFADELGEMAVSNPTKDYRELKEELIDLVITRPLLIYHKQTIAEVLLKYLQPETPALLSFAKLAYHFCKDLKLEFVPFLDSFVERLIAILSKDNVLRQNVTLIHTVFLVITGFLRELSPLIDADETEHNILKVLLPIIKILPHRSEVVRRLAGESLSVCVRKIRSAQNLSFIIKECIKVAMPFVETLHSTNYTSDKSGVENVISGVSCMLFECFKGVNGKWHSRSPFFLEVLMRELPLEKEVDGADTQWLFVTDRIVESTVKRAVQHVATSGAIIELFSMVTTLFSKTFSAFSLASFVKYVALFAKRPKLLNNDFVRELKTFCDKEGAAMVRRSLKPLTETEETLLCMARSDTPLHSVASFILSFAKFSALGDHFKLYMEEIFASPSTSLEVLCHCVEGLADVPLFSTSVRTVSLEAVERKCASHANPELVLPLLSAQFEDASEDEKLLKNCAQNVVKCCTSDEMHIKYLAFKLTPHLSLAEQKKLLKVAEGLVADEETHPIIASFALKILLRAGSKRLWELVCVLLDKNAKLANSFFVSPAIAVVLAEVCDDAKFKADCLTKAANARKLELCALGMVRSGHPQVRLSGNCILSSLHAENADLQKMLDAAERGETLRMDILEENREKVLAYDGVLDVVRSASSKDNITNAEVAGSLLLGALNVRFRPLWAKATEGLRLVAARNIGVFWQLFVGQLDLFNAMEGSAKARDERGSLYSSKSRTREKVKQAKLKDAMDIDGEDDNEAESDSDDESSEDDDEPPASLLLWEEALEEEHSNKESATVQSQFKSLWDLIESLPSDVLMQKIDNVTLYENILLYYTKFEQRFHYKQAAHVDDEEDVKPQRRILPEDVVTQHFMKILMKQEKPEVSLTPASLKAYKQKLWDLLSSENETIQRTAIGGLKNFQEMKKFGKYEDKLCSILPHKGLKNVLIGLDFDNVRAENIQNAVFQILKPKIWQNKHNTRNPVLQFICGINEIQFTRFINTVLKPIVDANVHFSKRKSESKYLEFLVNVVDNLGTRLENFVNPLCENLVIHLEQGYRVIEGRKIGGVHKETRKVGLNVLTKIFGNFPDYDYSESFMVKLKQILEHPIKEMHSASGAMGALFTFLTSLSEDEKLIKIIERLGAVQPLVNVLSSPSLSIEVFIAILKILSALIKHTPHLFAPHVFAYVRGLYTALRGPLKGSMGAFTHAVTSLKESSDFVISLCSAMDENAEHKVEANRTLVMLMNILIDILLNKKTRPSEASAGSCTDVLIKILPNLNNDVISGDAATRSEKVMGFYIGLYVKMAPLFYVLRFDTPREKLGIAYVKMLTSLRAEVKDCPASAKKVDFMLNLSTLLTNTNKMTTQVKRDKSVDVIDFDSRISAFYNFAEFFNAYGGKNKNTTDVVEDMPAKSAANPLLPFVKMPLEDVNASLLLPVAHNLAYYIANEHQSIRTTSSLSMKALLKTMRRVDARHKKVEKKYPQTCYEAIVQPVVMNGARIGVRLESHVVRQAWMKIYGAACLSFTEIIPAGLANINSDFDFFENITHQQTSRQNKALSTFRQHSKELPESALEAIFIPYFLSLLQSWGVDKRKESEEMTLSESSKLQAITASLLKTFSHISSHLSWGKYHRLVLMLLKQECSSKIMEKSVCQCIGEVLAGFHFLPTAVIKPYEFEAAEDDDEDDKEKDKMQLDTSEVEKNKRIGDVLVEKIIPAVHRFWKKGNKTEDGEEKISLTRIPLSVSILKLLKFIPDDVEFVSVIDSILTDLVSKLKTKKQDQRDRVREILATCLGVLGPQFFGKVVLLLRAGLEHGYQLHVLGYTVVTMINQISATFGITKAFEQGNNNDKIDRVVPVEVSGTKVHECVDCVLNEVIDILLDDNIGVSGTEKEVEELKKTMKEVKKNRSLEGLELLATIATPDLILENLIDRVQTVFTPMEKVKKTYRPEEQRFKSSAYEGTDEKAKQLDAVDKTNDLHLVSKIKTILRRCSRGVIRNALFDAEAMIAFSCDTLEGNMEEREKYLEQFEVKQNSMRVRLHESSTQSNIANIRKTTAKVHWLVGDQPERRDQGFERREVTSQRRQMGSVRKKGKNESKKRIAVPGIAARQTLQSIDCIDELAISLSWNLVNHSKEKGLVPLLPSLISPIIEVSSGEASDSVVTLSFLVLNEVMKNHEVEVDEETVAEVMGLAFDVVERSGEIRSACFRLMSILLLHRQAGFNEQQAAVCCSLIQIDLDKKVHFVIPALHLIKAIIVRKIEVADIYEIIPIVQEKMLHHAKSSIIAHVAGSIVARFLTDWRMSEKKLGSHIDFVVKNLQYDIAEGRIALLDLLQVCGE